MHLPKAATRTAFLAVLLLATGCGQTGPLVLPDDPAPMIPVEITEPPQDPNTP